MHKPFVLLLLLQRALASEPEPEPKLHTLYGVHFQRFLKANPVALIALHDNSPASQRLLPKLESLSERLASEGLSLKIAKMSTLDAPSYQKLWKAYRLPHLRLYVGEGVFDDFRGSGSARAIYQWAATILKNPEDVALIDSDQKADHFNEEPFAFYLRFSEDQRHFLGLLAKFRKLDNNLKVFYANKAIVDAFESYNPKELVVGFRRNFDDGNKVLASKRLNKATIHNFFEHFRHPQTARATEEVAQKVAAPKQRSFVLFEKEPRSDILHEFKNLAAEYRLAFHFVQADMREEAARKLAESVGVKESDLPALRIIDSQAGKQRVFEVRGRTFEELAEEIGRYEKGDLRETIGGDL